MRGARHPVSSLGAGVLVVALVAILASGCGSSDTNSAGEGTTTGTAAPPGALALACTGAPTGIVEALRTSGVGCRTGRLVAAGWTASDACAAHGTSRTSCAVSGYRCLGIATERGLAVSCARPGRSISFVASTAR
jgi:hypothetical protein